MSDKGCNENSKGIASGHEELEKVISELLEKLDAYENTGKKIIGYIKLMIAYAVFSRMGNLDSKTITDLVHFLQSI